MKFVNYTPLVVGFALLVLWIWWHLSVKKWFKGPKTTIDLPASMSSADEIAYESHHHHEHSPTATAAAEVDLAGD
jgi:hypothetical protein